MVYALATGRLWFRVPETIRYEFTGDLQPAVSWKDVILHLAGRFGSTEPSTGRWSSADPAPHEPTCRADSRSPTWRLRWGAKFGLFAADAVPRRI